MYRTLEKEEYYKRKYLKYKRRYEQKHWVGGATFEHTMPIEPRLLPNTQTTKSLKESNPVEQGLFDIYEYGMGGVATPSLYGIKALLDEACIFVGEQPGLMKPDPAVLLGQSASSDRVLL